MVNYKVKKNVWRDATEPPKNYIWIKINERKEEIGTFIYNFATHKWVEILPGAQNYYTKTETDLLLTGKADLDDTGKVPTSELPSYVDDVIDGYYDSNTNTFYSDVEKTQEITPEKGKMYVDVLTDKIYRWSGSIYIEVSASANFLTEITYDNLKTLKTNSLLIPGGVYRITDYECTVNEGLAITIAGHPFDILVKALSTNTLDEVASAIVRNDATAQYWLYSDLSSWELKYKFDQSNKYSWCNNVLESVFKGVIYYMKDDYNNIVYYDFKNILYDGYYTFTFCGSSEHSDASVATASIVNSAYNNIILPYREPAFAYLNNIILSALTICNNSFDFDCRNLFLGTKTTTGNTIQDNKFCSSNAYYTILDQQISGCTFINNTLGDSFDDPDDFSQYFSDVNKRPYIFGKTFDGIINITGLDSTLSNTSTNPVQNKAIYSSLLWQTDSTNKGIVSKTNLTTGGKATGVNSFACGDNCTALGDASHVEGIGSTASENYSHAQGKYNVTGAYADIIGGGTNANARKNIETTDWSGNKWVAGKVKVGNLVTMGFEADTIPDITEDNDLTTKKYVDTILNADEETVSVAITQLLERVSALEKLVSSGFGDITVDTININKGVNQYDSLGNNILRGTTAPTTIPQFIGQEYINTIDKTIYKAIGAIAVSDWVQIN